MVELVGPDGFRQRREIAVIECLVEGLRFDEFGLSLEEGKAIQRRVQKELTQFQVDQASQHDRKCHNCDRHQGVHDYRSRTIYSLFGLCRLRVPRFRSCACEQTTRYGSSIETLLKSRTTPKLERIQAELGSRLSFREAAGVLNLFVPSARPHNHRTVRNRLAKVADQIKKWDAASP